jgi:hypothetical protein
VAQETTDEKQLQDGIANVNNLDNKIQDHNVIAKKSARARKYDHQKANHWILYSAILKTTIVVHILINILH